MSLKPEPHTFKQFFQNLDGLRQNGQFLDLALEILSEDGQTTYFYVHKLVLIVSCSYFGNLLDKDGVIVETRMPPQVKPLSLSMILDYLYGNEICLNQLNPGERENLALTADLLGLENFRTQMKEQIEINPIKTEQSAPNPKLEIKLERLDDDSISLACKTEPVSANGDYPSTSTLSASNVLRQARKSRRKMTLLNLQTRKRLRERQHYSMNKREKKSKKEKKEEVSMLTSNSDDELNNEDNDDNVDSSPKEIYSERLDIDFEKIKRYLPNGKDRRLFFNFSIKRHTQHIKVNYKDSWHPALANKETLLGSLTPLDYEMDARSQGLVKIVGEMKTCPEDGNKVNLTLLSGGTECLEIFSENGKVKCPFCPDFLSLNKLSIAVHFLYEHGYLWIDFGKVCSVCGCAFVNEKHLDNHLKTVHKVDCPKKKYVGKLRLEDVRKPAPPSRRLRRLMKKKKIIPPGPYVCEECNMKEFPYYSALQQHINLKHVKLSRYICQEPGCSFTHYEKVAFLRHLYRIHNISLCQTLVLRCDKCDYTTLKERGLRVHAAVHDPESVTCPVEGCSKIFSRRSSVNRHLQDVHVRPTFGCEQCGSVFHSKLRLQYHVRNMHRERTRRFKCAYCSHMTYERGNCRKHLVRSHSDKPVQIWDILKSVMVQ